MPTYFIKVTIGVGKVEKIISDKLLDQTAQEYARNFDFDHFGFPPEVMVDCQISDGILTKTFQFNRIGTFYWTS